MKFYVATFRDKDGYEINSYFEEYDNAKKRLEELRLEKLTNDHIDAVYDFPTTEYFSDNKFTKVYYVQYLDDDADPIVRYFKSFNKAKKQIELWNEQQKKGTLNALRIFEEPRLLFFADDDEIFKDIE